MNFAPKFLPYNEALRIVAERTNPKGANPLNLALNEDAIVPELRKNGEWTKAHKGEWENLRVWYPSPLVASHQQPGWDDQIAHWDVRIETSEIDRLWPELETEKAKGKGGAPFKADWPAIEEALASEIDAVGFPNKEGAPGWRTNADVIRWVEKRLSSDEEPGKTTLKENVNRMLTRIAKKGEN